MSTQRIEIQMFRALSATFLCLLIASISMGQEAVPQSSKSIDEEAFANSINLRMQTMQVAMNESQNLDSKLELVEDQKQSLETLTKDYAKMVRGLMELEKTEGGMEGSITLLLGKLDGFEKRLNSDILLPHQATALRSMVFATLVKDQGGDLLKTLSIYYPKKFKLDASQKIRMKEIKKAAADKIAVAKLAFEKELKQIAADAEKEARTVLTGKQSKALEEIQGR